MRIQEIHLFTNQHVYKLGNEEREKLVIIKYEYIKLYKEE